MSQHLKDEFKGKADTSSQLCALQTKFGNPSRMRRAQLTSDFWGKMLKGQSVSDYIRQKRLLQTALAHTKRKLSEDDLIDIILVGARDSYESVVESLEHKSDLKLGDLFQRLEHTEEARRSDPATAAVAISKSRCEHCKGRHPSDNCWKKYPEKMPAQFRKANQEREACKQQAKSATTEANKTYDSEYTWCADSGCTKHMTGNRTGIVEYQKQKTSVSIVNNEVIFSEGKGKLPVSFELPDGSVRPGTLDELHVPDVKGTNLFSVKQAVKGGKRMTFAETGCELRNRFGALEAVGDLSESGTFNLRMLNHRQDFEDQNHAAASAITLDIAHQRIAHRNIAEIKLMSSCTRGLNLSGQDDEAHFCEACAIGKAKRKAFPRIRKSRTKDLCEVFWFDT